MSNRGHRAEAFRGMHYKVQHACAQVYHSVSRGGGEGHDCVWVYRRRQQDGGMACTYWGRGRARPGISQCIAVGQLLYLTPFTGVAVTALLHRGHPNLLWERF